MDEACNIRREPAQDLGTKALPVHRLRQLRQRNGLVLDRSENAVNGVKEDGQDEGGQQRAAVQTTCGHRQGDGGVLEAPWSPVRASRGTKSASGQMLGAMCGVTDMLADNIFSRSSGAQWGTGKWVESLSHRCISGRHLAKGIFLL